MRALMKRIDPYHIDESVFRLLDKDWMLITAGNAGNFNTMTASWGGFGIMWNEPVAYIFVRPHRFTYQFLEQYEWFTLCFFGPGHRKMLSYCGSQSGRDKNKITETGLIPQETAKGNIWFRDSRLVFECRKLYYHDLEPGNFLDSKIESNYPGKDYHRMYIGKIENSWIKEDKR
jgi:flavin reductase (DIM6/NTAB) family NADH-FMN oxidoreductase RutF